MSIFDRDGDDWGLGSPKPGYAEVLKNAASGLSTYAQHHAADIYGEGMTHSKQFEHLQEQSRQALARMIPPDCPLRVERVELLGQGRFRAITLDERADCQVGRFEVVAAYITGFVSGWLRGLPPSSEHPGLYLAARDACHAVGVSWTDPRTGVTFPPPKDTP